MSRTSSASLAGCSCLLLIAAAFAPGAMCVIENRELAQLTREARKSNIFSGAFARSRLLVCRGDPTARLELLRELSKTFVSSQRDPTLTNVPSYFPTWPVYQIGLSRAGGSRRSAAHSQLFTLDLECPGSGELLAQASRVRLFSAPFKWLLAMGPGTNGSPWQDLLAGMDAYPDSDVVLWRSGELLSVYRLGCCSWRLEPRAQWGPNRGLTLDDPRAASNRRRNLAATRIAAALVITDPDTMDHLDDYHLRHIDTIMKCNYPWVLHLMEMLNATVDFRHSNSWGYLKANGSWDGMTGMLQRGEVDIGGTGTFLTRQRMDVLQYIPLSTPSEARFIFRQPPLSSVSNLFKLPFRNTVWVGILALVVTLVAMLYPAMRLEWLLQSSGDGSDHAANPPNLSDDVLVVMGAVSQQGSWYEPRSTSARVIVLMSLLAGLNLYSAYTANIVALLQSTTPSIDSLQRLLDGPLSLACHDTVYNRYYFKSSGDPLRRAILEERIEPRGSAKKGNWLSLEQGVERMRHGYFAFHVVTSKAYKLVQQTFHEDEKCGFQEIDFLNVLSPHMVIAKGSPYAELVRVGAVKLHEIGLRSREINRWYTKKPVCGSARRFLSVGLMECYGAFVLLLTGLLAALGLFAAEIFNSKFS